MNQEELFKQIMDAICKKRCVSPADICGLIELGIPAGTSACRYTSLDEFISEMYYFWSLRRRGML